MSEALITLESTGKSLQVSDTNPVSAWHTYLEREVSTKNKTADTIRTYRVGLQKFQQWGRDYISPGNPVTQDVIENWITDLYAQDKKVKSVALWLTGVRSFFKFARRRGLVPFDPTEGIEAGRNAQSRTHKRDKLTDEEAQKLLSMENQTLRDKTIIALCLYTGARQVELWRANFDDIRTINGQTVLNIQGKGQREKTDTLVIASKFARDTLRSYLAYLAERGLTKGPLFVTERKYNGAYERISRRTLAHLIKESFERAGIKVPTKSAHSLRHTAISKILEESKDIRIAQRVARHASQATTEIYVHERERLENPGEQYIKYGAIGE